MYSYIIGKSKLNLKLKIIDIKSYNEFFYGIFTWRQSKIYQSVPIH